MRLPSPRPFGPFGALASILVATSLVTVGCASRKGHAEPGRPARGASKTPTQSAAEFRGMFVTTAYNKDWPSRPGLHKDMQRNEMRAVVRRAKELNCNVIILQVRAFGDRIYAKTALEVDGKKTRWAMSLDFTNDPRYDPLGEWIEACHNEGLLLYAWINPFRIDYAIGDLPFFAATDGDLYLDLTSKEVQRYAVKVVEDLLGSYGPKNASTAPSNLPSTQPGDDDGVDGVIIDHYYYYQPPPALPAPPGSQPPARYKWLLKKHKMPRPAANEATLDQFIEALFNAVKAKDAKFGISTTMRQFDQPETNVKKWVQSGWCHYFMPELYTADQDRFRKGLDRWLSLDSAVPPAEKPQIVPVLYTSAVEVPDMSGRQWDASDIEEQIRIVREKKLGQAFFTARSLRSPDHGGPPRPKHDVSEKIKKNHYQHPAPIPPVAAPADRLNPPKVERRRDAVYLSVPDARAAYFLVWCDNGRGWEGPVTVGKKGQVEYGPRRIRVEAYDRHGRKSGPVEAELR